VPPIPEKVLRFLGDHIDTVPQLEALLLMRADALHAWDEEELATRVYVDRETASGILQTLCRRLLIVTEDSVRYRYGPKMESGAELIDEVAAVYRQHLVAVANYIHSKASVSEYSIWQESLR